MWKIIVIGIVLCLVWIVGHTIYGLARPKKKTVLKNPSRHLKTEQILGKCRTQVRHSKSQVATYAETENTQKNDSTFAGENKKRSSEQLSEEHTEEVISELPEIDDVPLEYEPKTKSEPIHLGEEEEVIHTSADGNIEYANGIDLEAMMAVLGMIAKTDTTLSMQKAATDVFDQLEGTIVMDKLREEPKRSARIDELINARFAEYSEARVTQEVDYSTAPMGADDFDIRAYLPDNN